MQPFLSPEIVAFQGVKLFNARTILKDYRDYDLDTVFDSLYLSKHEVYGANGYYKCVTKVLL